MAITHQSFQPFDVQREHRTHVTVVHDLHNLKEATGLLPSGVPVAEEQFFLLPLKIASSEYSGLSLELYTDFRKVMH